MARPFIYKLFSNISRFYSGFFMSHWSDFSALSFESAYAMKKSVVLWHALTTAVLFILANNSLAQQIGLKWVPTGLVLGNIGFQGEYNFGKNSLTAKIGIPVSKHQTFEYDGKDADFYMKAVSFLAGYRTYLSKKHMKGLYLEPYFKYVHHSSEGTGQAVLNSDKVIMNFTNDYNAAGVGAQLGVQFMISRRIVVDFFFLGPEINSAKNTFKALETSTTLPWTSIQATEAEEDIRDFIDQFPIIRNRTDIKVDQAKKAVMAHFKGGLPGYRVGISFGVAF